mmetsp:Transcript_43308/g.70281  ORF Transcript_43308/g.70281 Transcript_43308/m.70281 type:complete len:252 (+) Transcript_43308:1236-1991(+)
MPKASIADAIVLAVYMPPHDPDPGQACFSTSVRRVSSIFPAPNAPMASNELTTVRASPSRWPGRMVPPYRNTPMALLRAMGISAPGMLLSQPPRVTMPSAEYPSCIVSIQSAMRSRLTSENLIPSIPMVSPSLITGVPKTKGFPPCLETVSTIIFPSSSKCALQGVALVYGHATVTMGLSKSSSSKPTALSIARAALRLDQSPDPRVPVSFPLRCFILFVDLLGAAAGAPVTEVLGAASILQGSAWRVAVC